MPGAAPRRVNVSLWLTLTVVYGFCIFMSFGKEHPEHAVHPSFLCAQFPQVPVADMAQKDLPDFTSLTSPRIISATTARRTIRINMVDMLLDMNSVISLRPQSGA
jgi:hypothetical protein